jgi:RNA recognition motif-containing protein
MDKISKRSKGYAFLEYTTEEAASSALKEMNGKVGVKRVLVSLHFCFNCPNGKADLHSGNRTCRSSMAG